VSDADVGRILAVLAAQIDEALREADTSVNDLTRAFADASAGPIAQPKRPARMNLLEAIKALQFFDRLSQRLRHVHQGLALTAHFMENASDGDGGAQLKALRARVHACFSMETERALFERIVTAPPSHPPRPDAGEDSGTVELF
jgi:hypothetical protein